MENYLRSIAIEIREDLLNSFTKNAMHLKHRGQRGTAHEIAFMRDFICKRMPFYGASGGEIVDSKGFKSKQLDTIIYDKHVTPIFFSAGTDIQVIPIEGVLATIEIKSMLNKNELIRSLESGYEIKSRPKTAYWSKSIEKCYNWYNKKLMYFPPVTCIVANDSVSMNTIGEYLNKEYQGLEHIKRMDIIYVLKKGLIYYDRADSITRYVSDLDDAAFMFFTILHGYLAMAYTPRIRLHDYAGDFSVNSKILGIDGKDTL